MGNLCWSSFLSLFMLIYSAGFVLALLANEKAINAVYYSTIGAGSDSLSPAHLQAITEIAYQCPATGGKGVYKARALYRMLYGFVFFDDVGVCATQGVSWRKPKTYEVNSSLLRVTILPNPADGKTTLMIEGKLKSERIFTVYNSLGETIMECVLSSDIQRYEFSTQSWGEGIYFYHLNGISDRVQGKFIVIH